MVYWKLIVWYLLNLKCCEFVDGDKVNKKGRLREIIEYLLIIALYYVTGGAFSYTNYSLQITLFFAISLFLCCILGEAYKIFIKNVFIPWMFMFVFILIVPLFWDDSILTYIAIIMQLSIGMFCASIIPRNDFIDKFIKVIVVFAAISLIGFTIGMVMPNVATLFPITVGDASVDYYNAFVYVFMQPKGYGAFRLTTRNAGICWEPGCYQMFLNVGLFFLLEKQSYREQKLFIWKFLILMITIITTMSTTGIVLMIVIIIANWKVWSKIGSRSFILIPVIIAVAFWGLNYFSADLFIANKFSVEFGQDNAFLDRLSLSKIQYIFSENGIPYIFGMSFSKLLTKTTSLWNSVIHSFLCLGIPFTFIQLTGYWKGTKVLASKYILLFIMMILCASTETLFWRVFFDTFAFYGWMYDKE